MPTSNGYGIKNKIILQGEQDTNIERIRYHDQLFPVKKVPTSNGYGIKIKTVPRENKMPTSNGYGIKIKIVLR
jgi:NCAIR mutase (PurE)-related protein